MHKIVINKLGPIAHAELECSQFMVLTGCQASGKSTVAKVLFYFRTIKDDILSLIIKKVSGLDVNDKQPWESTLERALLTKFSDFFGNLRTVEKEMCIRCFYDDSTSVAVYSFRERNMRELRLELSPNIVGYLKLTEQKFSDHSLIGDEEKGSIKYELSLLFNDEYETVFIPASRSMITLLATQWNYIYSTMDDAQKRTMDFCTRSYIENVIRLKPRFDKGLEGLHASYGGKLWNNHEVYDEAKGLIASILQGSYHYNNGDERLEIDADRYIKINFASSGQQESVWILNLLFYYLLRGNPVFFIIEEPESHLFPEAQKAMTELTALVYNSGHSMLVTTHSPYVLGGYNNLIYASQFPENEQAQVEKVIRKSFWINKKHVNAWFVKDGKMLDCIEPETGMIQSELIDKISGVINDEFDELLSIQMQSEERGE